MQRKELGDKIAAYGLTEDLRDLVASRRKNKKRPSRDTVWRAFNTEEESPLLRLIQVAAQRIIKDHEAEFGSLEPVELERERQEAAVQM